MRHHAGSTVTWSGGLVAMAQSLGFEDIKFALGLIVSIALGALGLYIHVSERLADARRRREWAEFEQRQRMQAQTKTPAGEPTGASEASDVRTDRSDGR